MPKVSATQVDELQKRTEEMQNYIKRLEEALENKDKQLSDQARILENNKDEIGELKEIVDEERERVHQEKERAKQEKERADREKQRADLAEALGRTNLHSVSMTTTAAITAVSNPIYTTTATINIATTGLTGHTTVGPTTTVIPPVLSHIHIPTGISAAGGSLTYSSRYMTTIPSAIGSSTIATAPETNRMLADDSTPSLSHTLFTGGQTIPGNFVASPILTGLTTSMTNNNNTVSPRQSVDTVTSVASTSNSFGLKIPTYKMGTDIEIFISRFEQYCKTYGVDELRKANLVLNALDETAFTVVNRELTDNEKENYNTIKEHLVKRFDVVKEKGQRRLILRQARRKAGQDLQAFYTDLLGLAAKAFPSDNGVVMDEAIMDQFICGCDDEKVRLHLLDKAPKTSREALSLAISYQAAIRYNESIKDNNDQRDVQINTVHSHEFEEGDVDKQRGRRYNRGQPRSRDANWRARGNNNYNNDPRQNYNTYNNGPQPNYNNYNNASQPNYNNYNNGSQANYNNYNHAKQSNYNNYNYDHYANYSSFNNGPPQNYNNYNNGHQQNYNNYNNEHYRSYDNKDERTNANFSNNNYNNNNVTSNYNNGYRGRGGRGRQVSFSNNVIEGENMPATTLNFLGGKLNDEDKMMLLDTGAAITTIDEQLWNTLKSTNNQLEKTTFSVRSATKHALDILGQTDVTFTIPTRKVVIRNLQ